MYVAAIIPTIDESETIGALVRTLDKTCDQIMVSDSSDNPFETFNAAADAGALSRHVPRSMGLAGAYAWGGFKVDPDWYVVHIDAGGSHDPYDVGPMLDIAAKGVDCVIGSRFCEGGEHHGPWKRRVTSRIASRALNVINGAWDPNGQYYVADWTSGFRVYSPAAREVLARHEFKAQGHAWQIEALWTIFAAGLRVAEFPIVYESSVSHLSSGRVKEAWSLYWTLARS